MKYLVVSFTPPSITRHSKSTFIKPKILGAFDSIERANELASGEAAHTTHIEKGDVVLVVEIRSVYNAY